MLIFLYLLIASLGVNPSNLKFKQSKTEKIGSNNLAKKRNYGSLYQPAMSCQDIWKRDPSSKNGHYWIGQTGTSYPVYCQFYPEVKSSNIPRQEYPYPQEVNIALPNTDEGDPEGAMGMQYRPEDLPPGVLPHFTQDVIDDMEKMYWNKTKTIADLIEFKNELERNKTREAAQKQNSNNAIEDPFSLLSARDYMKERLRQRKRDKKAKHWRG